MASETQKDLCIYCGERPAAPREHFLPRALGRFREFATGKRVLCKAEPGQGVRGCNVELGELYQDLFREGLYSLLRRQVEWHPGRRRRKRDAASPYERPGILLDGGGHRFLAEVERGMAVGGPARQIVFLDRHGGHEYWVVPPDVGSADDLRAAAEERGFINLLPAGVCDPDEGDLGAWITEVFPCTRVANERRVEFGPILRVEASYRFTPRQRRAVAMMAFHMFVAAYSATGRERDFDDIRAFIKGEEGARNPFALNEDDQSWCPFGDFTDGLPERPKHLFLVGQRRSGEMVAFVRLFADSAGYSPYIQVRLSEGGGRLAHPLGTALVYHENGPKEIQGTMTDGEALALKWSGNGFVLASSIEVWTPGSAITIAPPSAARREEGNA